MSSNPQIHVSDLPDGENPEVDFPVSSFFRNNHGQCLPTPAEVLALLDENQAGPQPPPVIFEHLNLLVKFGRYVTVAEAQCLYIIKKVLGNEVPVPELYGWRVDGHCVFIYMELIHGVTLRDQWDSMDISDKTSVCDQLSQIMTSLRRVEQDPNDIFIGSINRGRLLDMIFENEPPGGPFATIKQFHNYFSSLPWLRFDVPKDFKDPWREFLPDTGSITLTHADLHRGNIIVSPTKPPRILAIVDWAHCGWYPDYWEYTRAAYTCSPEGEWRNRWIPAFLTPRIEEDEIHAEYTHAMGVC